MLPVLRLPIHMSVFVRNIPIRTGFGEVSLPKLMPQPLTPK